MEIVNFRAYEKNTLKGFVDVKLSNGIILKGFTFHIKNDSAWVNPPAKRYIDDDGTEKYDRIVEFESKGVYNNFNRQVVRLIQDWQAGEHDDTT